MWARRYVQPNLSTGCADLLWTGNQGNEGGDEEEEAPRTRGKGKGKGKKSEVGG